MEYAKIKDWLDRLVKNYKEACDNVDFNNQICTCSPGDGIHVYKGIEIVADIMGFKLKEESFDLEPYQFRYSFVYDGVKFFQIYEKRIGKYVRAD